jgi:hypothetical protein
MAQSNDGMSETSSIIIAMIYLALFLLLINYFSYIFINAWYYLRLTQLTMLSFIPDWMPFSHLIPYEDGFRVLKAARSSNIDMDYINQFDSFFAPFTSWIPALFAYHLYLKLGDRAKGVTKKFSMEEILVRNSKIFPFLKPYVDFNPATMEDLEFERDDPHKLQYLPALNPVEYATMVPPLGLEKEAEEKEAFRLPLWDKKDDFDEDLARRSFESQLTNHYSNVEDSFTETQEKIFDFLSERAGMDRKVIVSLLLEYSHSIAEGMGIYAGDEKKLTLHRKNLVVRLEGIFKILSDAKGVKFAVDRFTNKKEIKKLAFRKQFDKLYAKIHSENLMSQHGFVVTGLMTLLEEARGGGVVPCVEFIWLKGKDRKLWYALQSVGRKTAFPEAGGAYSHWLLEKLVGKAITQPEVTSSVEALKVALFVDKKSLQQRKRQKEKMGF